MTFPLIKPMMAKAVPRTRVSPFISHVSSKDTYYSSKVVQPESKQQSGYKVLGERHSYGSMGLVYLPTFTIKLSHSCHVVFIYQSPWIRISGFLQAFPWQARGWWMWHLEFKTGLNQRCAPLVRSRCFGKLRTWYLNHTDVLYNLSSHQ